MTRIAFLSSGALEFEKSHTHSFCLWCSARGPPCHYAARSLQHPFPLSSVVVGRIPWWQPRGQTASGFWSLHFPFHFCLVGLDRLPPLFRTSGHGNSLALLRMCIFPSGFGSGSVPFPHTSAEGRSPSSSSIAVRTSGLTCAACYPLSFSLNVCSRCSDGLRLCLGCTGKFLPSSAGVSYPSPTFREVWDWYLYAIFSTQRGPYKIRRSPVL